VERNVTGRLDPFEQTALTDPITFRSWCSRYDHEHCNDCTGQCFTYMDTNYL